MALEEFELELSIPEVPTAVAQVIKESNAYWDQFFKSRTNRRFPRLIPSDPALVYAALDWVTQQGLPPGRVFCEWGSGFGTCTCLAALLGYEAYGIEIQAELAEISRNMARRLDIPVEILCASFIPEGYESYSGMGGDDLVKDTTFSYPGDPSEPGPYYDGLSVEIDEIDLFFVYPWPEEQELMQKLFDAVAAEGAILIAYYSAKEIYVYRKLVNRGDYEDWVI